MLGRYRVAARLAEGGAAEVLRARDERDGAEVVIKVPLGACQQRALERERFRREVEVLRRLDHPSIVPVLDAGEERGLVFAVFPYLAGGSLRDRLRPTGGGSAAPLPLAQLHSWLPAVAEALDYAHGQGVIHRDVTPGNVLFDLQGRAWLADFGLAKAVWGETSLTPQGFAVGSPAYLAPEQVRDLPATGRTDQYALATIVYEWSAGRLPFPDASLGRLLLLKAREQPASLRSVAPGAPEPLVAAVDRALSREPSLRHSTCQAFVSAGCPPPDLWSRPPGR